MSAPTARAAAPAPSSATTAHPVIVVGAGIAGIACARALHDAGVAVRVLDRGRRLGGRMAVRTETLGGGGHPVDIGASYFTVRDERFAAVVDGWDRRGLARPWTDTFHLLTPTGWVGTTTGATRWAALGGLRTLVEDLAAGLDVTDSREVEEVKVTEAGSSARLHVDADPAAAVVLAMPDPQAADLLPDPIADRLGVAHGVDWLACLAVWAAWPTRWWAAGRPAAPGASRTGPERTGADFDGAFVDGSAVLSWIADDGRRRGDGAAVLVAHTTGDFAADRLDEPGGAAGPVLAELTALLAAGGAPAAPDPLWLRVHRWSLASPGRPHPEPFALDDALVGVCGDGWGPRSRVEQAWLSGHLLGTELAARLAGGVR